MKILLSTLNAKYVHSSLALAYLREYCRPEFENIKIREFTINENQDFIMAEIYREKPDILCFSLYIWNIEQILAICRDYKQIAPRTIIILGGPEVSYDAHTILEENEAIDYIVKGEGEITFKELLQAIFYNQSLLNIRGISYRDVSNLYENRERELLNDLDSIPFPYGNRLDAYRDKLIYYETSRGCPNSCSYCLSATIKGVRFFSLERVKADIGYLISENVKKIKFVDRTFNCHEQRALEIMQFIIDEVGKNKANTTFHFEICADLLSAKMLSFLKQVPAGLFDFEIGVQSTMVAALAAVNRKTDQDKLERNIKHLQDTGIHLHLDLIAGLPYEGYEQFSISFNDVYHLQPDIIQLGFLKLLKGSPIREVSSDYGYVFQTNPPYQVLENKYLKYAELCKLAQVEEIVDNYYNSGVFANTINYITENIYADDAFGFFEGLAQYWQDNQFFGIGHRKERKYNILKEYIDVFHLRYSQIVNELLKYDYLLNNKSYKLPPGITSCNPENINDVLNSLLRDSAFIDQYLLNMNYHSIREIKKRVILECFRYDPLDYTIAAKNSAYLFVYHPIYKKADDIIKINLDYSL